jgi:phospholipase/lecithinase/hemolysin
VVYFKNHYSSYPSIWNSSNSLFPIWFGINDIMNGYFAAPSNWTNLAEAVVGVYFEQAQELYDLGARNMLFVTVPPIQRTPKILAWNATAQAQAIYAVESFNCLVRSGVENFRKSNNESRAIRMFNSTPVFEEVLNNPSAYGAPDASCYNSNGVSCLWWNDFHPGQAIHGVLAGAVANLTGF